MNAFAITHKVRAANCIQCFSNTDLHLTGSGPVLETDPFSSYRVNVSDVFADSPHFVEYVPR